MSEIVLDIRADLGNTLSAVDSLKAKLGQTKENIELLKQELKDMGQSLSNNDKAIANTNKQLSGLNKNTKDGAKEAAALKIQLQQLSQVNSTLVTGIAKTKTELTAESAAMKTLATEVKAAENAGSPFVKGLGSIWGALRKIAYIIPGLGIAGLIGLLTGPLIEGFDMLLDKIRGVNKELVDMAEFNKDASKGYGKESSDLLLLRKAIENVNLPMATRLQAIKDLKKEFPGLFDGLKNEQLLTGNVAGAYDLATQAIIRKAKASAAASEIEKIEAQKFIILQRSQEESAKANERIRNAVGRTDVISGGTLGAGGTGINLSRESVQREIKERFNARKKGDQDEIDRLNRQEAFLADIYVQGADRVIEIEKEKIAKIKKVREKEAKEMPFIFSNVKVETSDEALERLNKAVEKVSNDPRVQPLKLQWVIDLEKSKQAFADSLNRLNQDIAQMVASTKVDAFASLGESLGESLGKGASLAKTIFGSLFQVLGAGLEQIGKTMITLGLAKEALQKFTFVPGIATVIAGIATVAFGSLIKNFKIPGFANGVTNFGGGLAMVGERGPELVRLPQGADVISNGRMNNMQSGGGQMVYIPAVTLRGQDLVVAFNRANQTIGRNG